MRISTGITLFLLAIAAVSCSPTKQLTDDQYLLNKNSIKIDRSELAEGIKPVIKQRPNRRILGLFRFHLGVYTLANRGKSTKFKEWVKRTIGEEPIVLDTALTTKSNVQIKQYLHNEGFFNAIVVDTTDLRRSHRANVSYSIVTGNPYRIRNISYQIMDPGLGRILLADTNQSLMTTGGIFSSAKLKSERSRITKSLRNHGFFEFNDYYITYDIDSSLKSNQADIIVKVADRKGDFDSTQVEKHRVFRVRDLFVMTDYNPLVADPASEKDTTYFSHFAMVGKSDKLRYKPYSLEPRIFIERDDIYKVDESDLTYRGLSDLGLFRFINIRFEADSVPDSCGVNWVDGRIMLSPLPKQGYKIELEGTNNGGNFGLGANFSYHNKNLNRGGEALEFRLVARGESVPNFVDEVTGQEKALLLNTFEIGPEINLRVPRFIWPASRYNKNRSANPTTIFSVSYNYQVRPEYIRNLMLLSMGLEYRETRQKRHFIYPAEINVSDFQLSNKFINRLEETGDPKLINYYRKYIITGGRYTYLYNTQEPNKFKNFIYLRFNFEVAGNSTRLYNRITSTNYSDSSIFKLAKIEYSQYVRPDIDIRFYQVFSENASIVYRISAGAGYAYLNSKQMPYERTFSAGGVNDIRAFRARTVGPGSFIRTADLPAEQLGDMKLNANIEYRFDVFKILEGAFFIDAGNIWNIRESEKQPGGQLKFNTFVDELAVGTGLGFRFDFNFFIFRMDAGVPVRDPSETVDQRWVIGKARFNNVNYNFGIGYPF
jgi:outer membrane protein assembly factor BamA